jgi:hypothetical protein
LALRRPFAFLIFNFPFLSQETCLLTLLCSLVSASRKGVQAATPGFSFFILGEYPVASLSSHPLRLSGKRRDFFV